MSQRSCVVNATVRPGGRGVQVTPTTVAYPSGCSAMVKMIVEITRMRDRKVVPSAILMPSSSALITAAYPNNGCAISLMTVEMVAMNPRLHALDGIYLFSNYVHKINVVII